MEGAVCQISTDCEKYLNCVSGACEHKGLFPMDFMEVLAYVIIPFIVGLANVGGVGGGIVKVPILVLILNYNTSQSTSIAYPITLGGCLANIFLLLKEKHPTQDKPLIDFGIAIILVPAILIGTNTGVLMNNTMPEIFLNGFFILFLCFVCPYLMKRGITMLKLEQQVRKELKEINDDMRQQSQANVDIDIIEIEKEIEEEELHGASGRFSQIQSKPKLERFKTIVEDYRNTVSAVNSYHFNTSEMKFHRQHSVMRMSMEKDKQNGNYADFAKKLAQAQEKAKEESEKEYVKKEKVKKEVDIELQDVKEKDVSVLAENNSQDQQQIEKNDQSSRDVQNESLQNINVDTTVDKVENTSPGELNDELIQLKEGIMKAESKKVPLPKILFLMGCLAVVSFFAFVLGGIILGQERCSAGYWVFFVFQYLCLAGLSVVAFIIMKREIASKHKCKYEFDENDLQLLELPQYLKITGAGFTAGFIAGMLGAGAGLVIVPVLLILGTNSRVASATSGFMYFFIAWASILQVIAGGKLPIEILLWYIGLALIGGGVFSPIVYWMVNRYKRNSFVLFIVFGIAFLNIISCILYIIKSNNLNGFAYLAKFKSYCDYGK